MALVVGAVACLPGKRDNTPLPDVADGTSEDGVAADGEAGDASEDAADSASEDSAAEDTGAADTGPAPLPKGCSEDTDCAPLTVSACVVATCDTDSGLCQVAQAKNGTPCTVADPCVVDATCKGGACTGNDKDCDDGNTCTDDDCLAFDGCRNTPASKLCDDGNPCTLADACTETACKGIEQQCSSVDPCRSGTCNPKSGECAMNVVVAGAKCNDGDPCTTDDTCDDKAACSGKQASCDDKNPCTKDLCAPKSGCVNILIAGPGTCDDGDACTSSDGCDQGKCAGVPVDCVDGKACTKDACTAGSDGKAKCTFTPTPGANCVDGAPCAEEASCEGDTCKTTKAKVCDDGNPCTKDSCVEKAGGCLYLATGGSCNDGDGCTTNDACKEGKCTGTAKDCGDGDPCTLDQCDPITTKCSNPFADEGTACGEGKACKLGKCEAN